jgi:hypothetical protein
MKTSTLPSIYTLNINTKAMWSLGAKGKLSNKKNVVTQHNIFDYYFIRIHFGPIAPNLSSTETGGRKKNVITLTL